MRAIYPEFIHIKALLYIQKKIQLEITIIEENYFLFFVRRGNKERLRCIFSPIYW